MAEFLESWDCLPVGFRRLFLQATRPQKHSDFRNDSGLGRLADTWGPRNVVIVGATLYVTGLVLASFCTELWMLFLTQGLIKGIGGGMFYMPPLALVPQYFARRRGLATGLMVSGVGLGGFALSSGTQAMLDKFGHQWALRITAIVSAVCLTYVAFAMRSRFPRLRGAPLLDFSKLKSKRFWLAAMTLFFIQLGFFSLTYFTPAWSVYNGLTQNQGANLVAFLNLFSFTGRIFQGFTADFAGVANVFVLCVLIAALCDLVYWPFSTTWASQMGLVFLYGAKTARTRPTRIQLTTLRSFKRFSMISATFHRLLWRRVCLDLAGSNGSRVRR